MYTLPVAFQEKTIFDFFGRATLCGALLGRDKLCDADS